MDVVVFTTTEKNNVRGRERVSESEWVMRTRATSYRTVVPSQWNVRQRLKGNEGKMKNAKVTSKSGARFESRKIFFLMFRCWEFFVFPFPFPQYSFRVKCTHSTEILWMVLTENKRKKGERGKTLLLMLWFAFHWANSTQIKRTKLSAFSETTTTTHSIGKSMEHGSHEYSIREYCKSEKRKKEKFFEARSCIHIEFWHVARKCWYISQ